MIDSEGFTTKYYYDFTERLLKYVESGTDYSHSVAYTYDLMNNLTGVVETINGTEFTSTYGYNDDNVLTSVTNGNNSWTFGYDDYGRLNAINGAPFNRTYNYRSVSDTQLTAQLASIAYPSLSADQTYAYTYDDNGNIASVTFGGYTYSYVYDSQNQLIRENNSRLGRTYTWTYDNAGNILSRSTYAYTTGELGTATGVATYSYGDSDWGDLLTGVGGNTITYDQIGNMLTIGSRSFTWKHGRQLASLTSGSTTWTYTYNADGMRTSRTDGTNTYQYIYNGSQLMRMVRSGVVVDFGYVNGIPATISFNGNTFYYITNGQGDITGITDSTGNLQITYYYDAWGTAYCTYNTATSPYAQSLYDLNPLLYRGYVFDREAGMYYLQSRYYIPSIGRFLNADGLVSTGQGILGNNMFAYCGNNPINATDKTGYLWDAICDWWDDMKDWAEDTFNVSSAAEKLTRVGSAAAKNVEFSAGIGMGYYGEADILDGVGLAGGMYVTNGSIIYQDGEWKTGQEMNMGFTATVTQIELGAASSGARISGGEWSYIDWFGVNNNVESITLFSRGFFAGPGAIVRIGFDLNSFLFDLDEIWK